MNGGTHNKILIVGHSRAQVLRDLADKCEELAVDGPVTVVYDSGLNIYTGTMFVISTLTNAPWQTIALGHPEDVKA